MHRVSENGDPRLRLVETRPFGNRIDQLIVFALNFLLRHLGPFLRSVFACTTVLALAGCEGPLSTVDPAGPAARTIATLWWILLAGATLIFAFVMMLLALAFRKRRPPDDDAGRERFWIIGLGLAFPVTVLLCLLGYGLWSGERLLPRDEANVVAVQAQARRWEWSFSYADVPGRTTENILHIPAGRPIDVAITTTDVIHSFWVPRLAGKLDAIPGHVNVLRIEADLPGTYAGRSAEFSGAGYENHAFTVVAHDAAGWEAFLRGEYE